MDTEVMAKLEPAPGRVLVFRSTFNPNGCYAWEAVEHVRGMIWIVRCPFSRRERSLHITPRVTVFHDINAARTVARLMGWSLT